MKKVKKKEQLQTTQFNRIVDIETKKQNRKRYVSSLIVLNNVKILTITNKS